MSEQPSLETVISEFAIRLRREFASEIEQDSRGFKKRSVHLFKVHLPPWPGRPREAAVTLALTMRDEGRNWDEVYPCCIEGYALMNPLDRKLARMGLRDSCRKRRNSLKRKKSVGVSSG